MTDPAAATASCESRGAAPHPDRALTCIDRLPRLEPLALHAIEGGWGSVADAVAEDSADPRLAGRLVAAAGAAARGRETITTLEQAIASLGLAGAGGLVAAFGVVAWPPRERGDSAAARRLHDGLCRHALAVGCAARRLASVNPRLQIDPHQAFVAGLLHDLGKLALLAAFPRAYQRAAAAADDQRGDIADGERALLGLDHSAVGRRLAERWGLSPALRDAIWLHHVAGQATSHGDDRSAGVLLVQLADTLAREQRLGYSGNHTFWAPSSELGPRLGFSEADLQCVTLPLSGEVAELARCVGLDGDLRAPTGGAWGTRASVDAAQSNADLLAANRRLTSTARYYAALTHFETHLAPLPDPADVVTAIAESAARALRRDGLVALVIRQSAAAVDVARLSRGRVVAVSTERLPPTLAGWLSAAGDARDAWLVRAPRALRELLLPLIPAAERDDPWWLPIPAAAGSAGGIVMFGSEREAAELGRETEALREYLASLGAALSRQQAQAEARRAADDLVEANRRLQQMRGELLRDRTLSSLAELAAGAAHELNGPLAVISGRAQLLRERLTDADAQRVLEQISGKAHECSRIVSELMDFARPAPPALATVDLVELLAERREAWQRETGLRPEQLVVCIDGGQGAVGAPHIHADCEQIASVLAELVRNAADALGGQAGRITITLRGATDAAATAGLAAGGAWVEVVVRDNGRGMPAGVAQRAFAPFFSHHAAGRRRGLGLARAQRIVDAHRGRIWLDSRPGEGTSVHVLLPAATA